MLFVRNPIALSSLRTAINKAYYPDETLCVDQLLAQLNFSAEQQQAIHDQAYQLVERVRSKRLKQGGIDAFLQQYDLSSDEGIALMCIAEAMLRIPDFETADKLIRDKLSLADWKTHLGSSESLFVNSATWALMLTGKIITDKTTPQKNIRKAFKSLLQRISEPMIRAAVGQAMKILGNQFVMGINIDAALKRARESEARGYRYSYDMLGEAARTVADAERYFQAYSTAIHAIGKAAAGRGCIKAPGISIKLSALHCRYNEGQRDRVLKELVPSVLKLAQLAKSYDIGFTIDAEETYRLDLSLDVIEQVFKDPSLNGWHGFGLALQSYQKRAYYVIDYLIDLARTQGRRLMVRLVKGAYWDSEIKAAQIEGREGYPVFTRKTNTDVSYLACVKKLLAATDTIYPQFATHNAYTLAAVLTLLKDTARAHDDFEFQCLHGMGQTLYDNIVGADNLNIPARIYAPVGTHKDLLPYLVRRLLENGANTSFVNRIVDERLPIDEIIADPVTKTRALNNKAHPRIPLPEDIYGPTRKNSRGLDLANRIELNQLNQQLAEYSPPWQATPTLGEGEAEQPVIDPSSGAMVGTVKQANEADLLLALQAAHTAFPEWNARSIAERAKCLETMADLLEANRIKFMALAIREAGKTLGDAIGEVREAIDYCRYYAEQARLLPADFQGRGVVLCISPWNFPLAIFLGQVTAALVTGNTVLAKPAETTPLIAAFAIELLHQAGVPIGAAQLIPGRGSVIGKVLLPRPEIQGVMFTGSTETAQTINRTLAERGAADVPLIAETGGQNAMIVDSSALPEQVVDDVILSAFGSAGQRCSALRVLFLQEDIADNVIHMLQGAMQELVVGAPALLSTDIGPVIDSKAQQGLQAHKDKMDQVGKLIYQVKDQESGASGQGSFFMPCAYEIPSLDILQREVFGPILHVIRYRAQDLPKVIEQINATGYGLTLGIHSRIDETVELIHRNTRVGNTYVNRSMIGAVVGVQPFGGEGLSGTGPKAGGPHYLLRLGLRYQGLEYSSADENFAETRRTKAQEVDIKSFANKLQTASHAAQIWAAIPAAERMGMLQQAIKEFINNKEQILRLLSHVESGIEFDNAIKMYQLLESQAQVSLKPLVLPGPTGEHNQIELHARGVVVSINGSHSTLALTCAQLYSTLVTGNVMLVRPAPHRIGMSELLTKLFLQTGAPAGIVQIIDSDLASIEKNILSDPRVNAVILNADADYAAHLYQQLALRDGALIPLLLPSEQQNYLWRLSVERTLTINTTAKGGNTTLLSLSEN